MTISYCNTCGEQVEQNDRFCTSCGTSLAPPLGSAASQPLHRLKPTLKPWYVFAAIVTLLAVLALVSASESARQNSESASTQAQAPASSLTEQQNPKTSCSGDTSPECDNARGAYAELIQKRLWSSGFDMRVSLDGTELDCSYAIAGDSFAYRFGQNYVDGQLAVFNELGITKVKLTNGDNDWIWNIYPDHVSSSSE